MTGGLKDTIEFLKGRELLRHGLQSIHSACPGICVPVGSGNVEVLWPDELEARDAHAQGRVVLAGLNVRRENALVQTSHDVVLQRLQRLVFGLL